MAKAKKAKKVKPLDAIELLKRDHAGVKKAFKDFEKAKYKDPSACKQFVAAICRDIEMHAKVEEEIFYPAVRPKLRDDDLMNEAEVEHKTAKQLIAAIERLAGDDPMLKANVTVLAEYIQHHVKEEEGEMFPKVKRAKVDLAGLGEQMLQRKEQLKAQT